MRLINPILLLLPTFCISQSDDPAGHKAITMLDIKTHLQPVIKSEFHQLATQLVSQFKQVMSTEVDKIRSELDLKNEQQTQTMNQILTKQENLVQQNTDLSITFENLQKTANANLQATTESLTSGFFETKTEVGQQMALFKSELQQNKVHLDNYASKLNSEQSQQLAEHTNKMYEQQDKLRKETISSINIMHQTLTQRISQISSRNLKEFKSREIILKRAIGEEFSAVTAKLENTLIVHKRDLNTKFLEKVDDNKKILSEDNVIMLQTINATLHNNLVEVQRMQEASDIDVRKQLREQSANINETLSGQAELSKKYVEHTIGGFRDDIQSIVVSLQTNFEDSNTKSPRPFMASDEAIPSEGLVGLQSIAEETKLQSTRANKEIQKTLEMMLNGHKQLTNKLEVSVSKLNRSMTDRAWTERREMIDQLRKSQDIVMRGLNTNHEGVKMMFETSVAKTIREGAKSNIQSFEEIMQKLTNIEDEREDMIPQLTDAVQNIGRTVAEDVKSEVMLTKASLAGKLTTIESSVQACVRNKGKDTSDDRYGGGLAGRPGIMAGRLSGTNLRKRKNFGQN